MNHAINKIILMIEKTQSKEFFMKKMIVLLSLLISSSAFSASIVYKTESRATLKLTNGSGAINISIDAREFSSDSQDVQIVLSSKLGLTTLGQVINDIPLKIQDTAGLASLKINEIKPILSSLIDEEFKTRVEGVELKGEGITIEAIACNKKNSGGLFSKKSEIVECSISFLTGGLYNN